MLVKDSSTLRASLVDGQCISFENRKSGKICGATREPEISAQTWRIPWEKMNISVLQDRVEENAGIGKYIPVQTNGEIQGDVLVDISNKPWWDQYYQKWSTTSRGN